MWPGVLHNWLNVVSVRSGPGNDRARLVPSTQKEELAPRAAGGPVCKCSPVRGSNYLPVGLPVSQSVSQSVRACVRACLLVRLLDKTTTTRKSRASRLVGEVRDFSAVKRLSNGTSDMMTGAEGTAKGAEMSERVMVIERSGRRLLVPTGLRLSCDTTATVPTHNLLLYVFCCSLRPGAGGLVSAAGAQGENKRVNQGRRARDQQARPRAEQR